MPEKCGCAALVDGNFPAAHVPVRMCPLHAAAPDLLAALKELVSRYDASAAGAASLGLPPADLWWRARAAIRKAEGGE